MSCSRCIKKHVQIATVSTSEPTLRAEIWGWSFEDSDFYIPGSPIGYSPSPRSELHSSILSMLACGWRLLGPPVRSRFRVEANVAETETIEWSWWLQREYEEPA